MKPIKFHISRHGLNVVGKFARWYHYTLFDSRRYTEDLTPKWNNLSDFFLPIDDVEQYGIGIKELPDELDPDSSTEIHRRTFPPLDLLPVDCTQLIMRGDVISCNSWSKEIKTTGDVIAVLENLRLEYDLQEENNEGN